MNWLLDADIEGFEDALAHSWIIPRASELLRVSGNHPSVRWFCNQVRWLSLKSLRRRSQKARLSWERFIRIVERFFPPIKVLHPLPLHRVDAKT